MPLLRSVFASLSLYTRVPFWRLYPGRLVEADYREAINLWPVGGLVTAPVAVGVLWMTTRWLPLGVAVSLALALRMVVTGALHEDGLADTADGLGGGRGDRARTLEIMKDSRIGSFGALTLMLYLITLHQSLRYTPLGVGLVALGVGDLYARWLGVHTTLFLRYARPVSSSKLGLVYAPLRWQTYALSLVLGLGPLLVAIWWMPVLLWGALGGALTFAGMVVLLRRRLGGYTGDTCGALYCLGEVGFLVGVVGGV